MNIPRLSAQELIKIDSLGTRAISNSSSTSGNGGFPVSGIIIVLVVFVSVGLALYATRRPKIILAKNENIKANESAHGNKDKK